MGNVTRDRFPTAQYGARLSVTLSHQRAEQGTTGLYPDHRAETESTQGPGERPEQYIWYAP